jgi:predicted Zn-dependent protease
MEKAQGANVGVTLACILTGVCNNQATAAAINVGGSALFAKFSRDDEAEADAEGVKNTVRAGIDPRGIPEMFQILIDERNRSPSAVEGWFATHPMEEDRIAATRAQIAKIDPAILNSLTKDSQSFQSFKQRLRGLPAAPPATRASR